MTRSERLKRYAQLALNAFEDLETELAIEIACANLRDLLRCLDTDDE